MVRLLVSTGEVSGDLQGGLLIDALRREAQVRGVPLEIVALGGERMRRAGATLLADTVALGGIGLWELLPLLLPTLRVQLRLQRWLRRHPLDGVVLIDYMGANVRLGLQLRRRFPGLPILYYIAPQEWAWRMGERSSTLLIRFCDRILAIFPEEARFYAARGASTTWVGHPLIDTIQALPSRQEARRSLDLDPEAPVLLLLPASRRQELRYLLPPMLAAVAELQRRHPRLEVLLPAAQASFVPRLELSLARAAVRARVVPADRADAQWPLLCAAADAALTKSGTANLQLALRDVPQVAGYRVSRGTALVARHLLRFRVDHITPVNLILSERLVPELLQDDLTPEAIVALLEPLLQPDGEAARRQRQGYDRLRQQLGAVGVTHRAAAAILDQLQIGPAQPPSPPIAP